MKELSPIQQQIYDYICQCAEIQGYPPSVREIGQKVGRSPSTVHFHLNTLEKLGYISRTSDQTRSVIPTGTRGRGGVPILGTVAAGAPILALEDALGYIPYDAGDNREHFALQIRGDSMRDAGILDGDLVIVRRQPTANSGEIVIALLEGEATCKRLRREQNAVWLLPENPNYDPIDGRTAQILGRVTTVIRNY